MSSIKQVLAEKYRPTNFNDYVFQNDNHRAMFLQYTEEKCIPNLLLSGTQGTGKSTAARILLRALPIDQELDVLKMDGSLDTSVEFVRDRIEHFVTTFSESGLKVVLIEEADRLSKAAQKALKVLTEDYYDLARFIIVCNHEHLLDKAFKSRFTQFKFVSPDSNDIAFRIASILAEENVKTSIALIDKFVALGYPDIRQTIHLIQQHIVDGQLLDPATTSTIPDWKIELLELITAGDWYSARKLLCGTVSNEEWEEVYTFIYRNIDSVTKWQPEQRDNAICVISTHLYRHSFSADPEINAASMLIELTRI